MPDTMLCMIPARAGSKRIPRKNLKLLGGKPLIAYTIEAALASGLFNDVYVCTDDEEIAAVAKEFGANVPSLMPPELCGDLSPSYAPCQHLATLLAKEGRAAESLLCLQPTSPLRSPEDIKRGVERFRRGDIDFLLSVTPIDPHYFHWALVPREKSRPAGEWKMYFDKEWLIERPLLPPAYRPNGSIKIARLAALKEQGNFFGEKLGTVETPEERSVHIGTTFDWNICEYLLSNTSHERTQR
ncbi:MAG: acylneuraminate cytidylyltransferase family protein [Candidatus Peribacteraceae bacterium]|jgi:CMP-N-acetylneuraminic acid synthetase